MNPLQEVASVLGGDYNSIDYLIQGGTGELFKGHKRGLDVDVVIKRCKSAYRGKMDETREARILKNLRHQYLPRIYDVIYAQDGTAYTVMELIRGWTLEKYVQYYGALPQKQVVKWMRQLCQVIAYLHAQTPSVIHSDLKPQNIMVTMSGDICVIDFNTSVLYQKKELQALGATAGYGAPEQYHLSEETIRTLPDGVREKREKLSALAAPCGKVTERTDIYALGAVGYFMLTGYHPKHSLEEQIPLERFELNVGDSLCTILSKAMSFLPEKRYSSAKAMLYALEHLDKTDRRYRHYRRCCRFTAVLLGLVIMTGGFLYWLGGKTSGDEQLREYRVLIEQADRLILQQNYTDSMEVLTEAASLNGKYLDAYLRMGAILYRQGKYDECVDLLMGVDSTGEQTAVAQELDRAQAELNYILGSCYFQQNTYEQAERYFELAVWFAPEEASYYADLAVAQEMNGNLTEAEKTFVKLQNIDGASQSLLLLAQSQINYMRGQYAEALENLQSLIEIGEHSSLQRAYVLAEQCFRKLGASSLNDQITMYEDALEKLESAELGSIQEWLVDAYLREGSTESCEKALRVIDDMERVGKLPISVMLNRVLSLQYLKRDSEALSEAEKAAETYPNNYRTYTRLALLLLSEPLYDRELAEENYQIARQLYSGSGEQNAEFIYLESLILEQ